MSALNPNHGVVREVEDHWYKLCAVVLFKSGAREIKITTDDMERFANSGYANIVVNPKGNVITLSLVRDGEAARLARKEGGLPV